MTPFFAVCLLLTLRLPALVRAQAAAPPRYTYLIQERIDQLNAPAKVYLLYGGQTLSSATLHDGLFAFAGTMPPTRPRSCSNARASCNVAGAIR
jgi:hypothetical protein